MQTFLVSDEPLAWKFLTPLLPVVDAKMYLAAQAVTTNNTRQVINACDDYAYQSTGYYVSLLAEARMDKVIPSVQQLQDTLNTHLLQTITQQLTPMLHASLKQLAGDHCVITLYFGQDKDYKYPELARKLHHFFPLPLLRVKLIKKRIGLSDRYSQLPSKISLTRLLDMKNKKVINESF